MDTIFAQATAKGKAGVAIIRISGPRAFTVVETLGGSVPPPHRSALRVLRDRSGGVLDEALVIAFPAGHSFTGEETVELQVHGSVAIVAALERELAALDGLRMAEPGEFTRRALENNRLDLAQVEGLADLVEAETEAQRKQAQRVFSGALGSRVAGWRDDLVRAAALLEVTIDFADEEVPVDVTPEVRTLIERVLTDLRAEIAGARVAERIRSGFEVAILGAPNAGKSSLLNYLAGREAAITSSIAGTTRDVIEVRMDLGGMPVTLLDTAGIRETGDEIERIGVSRALDRAAAADLRVVLTETGALPEGLGSLTPEITVLSKRDLHGEGPDGISVTTGQGIDLLVDRIAGLLSQRMQGVGTATRDRHRLAMERAADQLDATLDALKAGVATELLAEDLRAAIRALDSLIGRVDVDHLLGEIFASFCIGK